jgi:hypothetical protein
MSRLSGKREEREKEVIMSILLITKYKNFGEKKKENKILTNTVSSNHTYIYRLLNVD